MPATPHSVAYLRDARQGLEREVLRTDAAGRIALTAHPKAFGSPLTNSLITLDFAEAQIELVTPPLRGERALRKFLERLYSWSSRRIGRELLWPFSMPPVLPEHQKIPLARFGTSAAAEIKQTYREGLKRRYGGAVQTISGIHYNFSLPDSFWIAYAKEKGARGDLSVFKDEHYFGLMRNVIRFVPLVTYLFGASPVADKSFFTAPPSGLKKLDASTYVGPYATSLRLSDFGYHNARRSPVAISYNSLQEYLDDLSHAVSTPSKFWSALGVYQREKRIQLNTNILQLENEFYASIRPKQKKHTHPNQSVLCSLACAGVEYVELRSIDLDPYEPAGIGAEELRFLTAFMTHCLLSPSPRFQKGEQYRRERNNTLVALEGRKPGLALSTGSGNKEDFSRWALKTLAGIARTAELLDAVHGTKEYSRAVAAQKEKILHPERTPSARIIRNMEEKRLSYARYGVALARKYKSAPPAAPPASDARLKKVAEESAAEAARQEARDAWILPGYEHLELSTQVLIRAAEKRGIAVDIIDDRLNVIELERGGKREVVKQATITRYDTYLSSELMSDKYLTKLFLARAGLPAPRGGRFTSAGEAMDFYAAHRAARLVVKPASTNYGTGVSIVAPGRERAFATAVARALAHDETILVEEFIPGKEYRFLVIAGKVIAVLHRDPANVVGDGIHTVHELIALKNADPASYKLAKTSLKLGAVEREMLAEAGLAPRSVAARGPKVYQRKK